MGSWQLVVGSWKKRIKPTTNYELRTTGSTSSNRGFTLLELLITIGLFSLLMGLLVVILQDAGESAALEDRRQEILDETGRAVDEISRHIQTATRVAASYTDPQTNEVTTTSATNLVLELPAYDTNGVRLIGTYDVVIIKRDPAAPDMLVIQTVPGAGSRRASQARRPMHDVTNLTFRYFAPDDDDPDLDDELVTDPDDYPSVTRVEASLESVTIEKNRTIEARFVGGGTLRNRLIGS